MRSGKCLNFSVDSFADYACCSLQGLPARIIGHVRLALIGRLLTPGELRLKSAEPIDCHREAVVRDPVLGSMWTQRV
jgi:hypothetical protein